MKQFTQDPRFCASLLSVCISPLLLKKEGNWIFLFVAWKFSLAGISMDLAFFLVYTTTQLFLSIVILHFSHLATNWAWKRNLDPDTASIPCITSAADLLGTCLLVVAFIIKEKIH